MRTIERFIHFTSEVSCVGSLVAGAYLLFEATGPSDPVAQTGLLLIMFGKTFWPDSKK